MKLSLFLETILTKSNAPVRFALPSGEFVPAHYHLTEVGRVRKDFVDCGGVRRSTDACVLQLWVDDNDAAHRLNSTKFAKIVGLGADLMAGADPDVEVEYDVGFITQFKIDVGEVTPSGIVFRLGGKHTDCLANEKCGCAAPAAGNTKPAKACCSSTSASATACCA